MLCFVITLLNVVDKHSCGKKCCRLVWCICEKVETRSITKVDTAQKLSYSTTTQVALVDKQTTDHDHRKFMVYFVDKQGKW